jgi:hypothetical protein
MSRLEALSLLAFLGANTLAQSAGIRRLAQFPAEVFTGRSVPPVLFDAGGSRLQRDGTTPDFSRSLNGGAVLLIRVVVDARTGKVHSMLFGILGYVYSLKYGDGTNGRDDSFRSMQFSPKSRLLIVRGCPEDENCGAFYYHPLIRIESSSLKPFPRRMRQ